MGLRKLAWFTFLGYNLSCLNVNYAFSQNNSVEWNGQLLSSSMEPLPFANVLVKADSQQFILSSNRDGLIRLSYHKKLLKDSLIVSYLGYKRKAILIDELKSLQKIILERKSFHIDEVVVYAKKTKTVTIGNLWNKTFSTAHVGGGIAALYIPNHDRSDADIQQVRIYIDNLFKEKWKNRPFKLQLYDGSKQVGQKKLIKEDLIVSLNSKKSHWVEVDLKAFNLKLPKAGVFVCIQAMPYSYYEDKGIIDEQYIGTAAGKIANTIAIGVTKRNKSDVPIESWRYYGNKTGWRRFERAYYMMQLIIEKND